ncbi:MAG: phenylacetate-CoA oxygenase subunit PaaC [Bacteroidia bacterium]|nr:phenylacetate-CoA oxygenase subunit PaaC [Bacteroidia bacterium]
MDTKQKALFEYVLWLGDSALILGQRLGEWCGHGPYLEEDIAITNISLDLIGQARAFLTYAGELEGQGKDEDKLAFFRGEREYRNSLLVEQPNGDFGQTIVRQYFYSLFAKFLFEKLSNSSDEMIAGIAAKSLKETNYHVRHSKEWLIRLGDGTDESHTRMQNAIQELWYLTGDLFENLPDDTLLFDQGIAFDLQLIKPEWEKQVRMDIMEATLNLPEGQFMLSGGRQGRHTEFLGHILAEMQTLPRSIPDGNW